MAPAHVKKLPNGDVLLETVPMVDQGQKGYCVVATAERVMRYYGVQVDEHELAELANSSATAGHQHRGDAGLAEEARRTACASASPSCRRWMCTSSWP